MKIKDAGKNNEFEDMRELNEICPLKSLLVLKRYIINVFFKVPDNHTLRSSRSSDISNDKTTNIPK